MRQPDLRFYCRGGLARSTAGRSRKCILFVVALTCGLRSDMKELHCGGDGDFNLGTSNLFREGANPIAIHVLQNQIETILADQQRDPLLISAAAAGAGAHVTV
jgi:hypothetical protein